ncbi:hypothetical protein Pmani_011450 [Petrolisthes manimaculis]|uniref:RRM domain-containing protein n=1 Tax=Petrolisthes manimaculis TaxID=1843537 RepID=A0AAE1Q123_9EUCA|nr:hypothetical protein Pmani_011450 [Petrolisthes manimaculis]
MKVKKMKGSPLKEPEGITKPSTGNRTKMLKIVTDRKKGEEGPGEGNPAKESIVNRLEILSQRNKKTKKRRRRNKLQTNAEQVKQQEPSQTNNDDDNDDDGEGKPEESQTDSQLPQEQACLDAVKKKCKKLKKEKMNQGDKAEGDNAAPETAEEENVKPKEGKVKQMKRKYILFLGNLPYDIEEAEVEEHFKVLRGSIKRLTLLTDKTTGRGRGCGFLELSTAQAYQNALKLNLSQLKDHKIRVEYTVPGNKKNSSRKKFMKMKTKKILGQNKKAMKKNKKKNLITS